MQLLFDRKIELVVDTYELSDFDCTFRVKKNLKPEPNTAEIQIFNLAESTQKALGSAKKKVPVKIRAGYKSNIGQIYLGELRTAPTFKDGADWITQLSSGDGESARKNGLYQVIGPKTPPDLALAAIVKALGVGTGNLPFALAKLRAKGVVSLGGRQVIVGNAAQRMTDFCESAGLEWSIQNGQVQILDKGKPREGLAYLLSPATGLIGSPSTDNEGKVHAQTLMIPDLIPGQIVLFASHGVKGGYRVEETEFTGDTRGDDWTCNIVCKKF